MAFDKESFLETLTHRAGVYQMYDEEETLLYVGKAKNLRQRVSSYFRARGLNDKTVALVSRIDRIEVIVTGSETEALLLEQTLIKQHKPQYNILLKDDKSYPYIHVTSHEFPLLAYRRGKKAGKGKYFGPYPSAAAVRDSLNYLHRLFRIRNCEDSYFSNRSRACLQYQIKRCSGPCVGHISKEEYAGDIRHAEMFLQGNNKKLLTDLEQEMDKASEDLRFERAAELRDQLLQLRRIQEKQYVASHAGEADCWALAVVRDVIAVQRVSFRDGVLVGSKTYFPDNKLDEESSGVMLSVIAQYYFSSPPVNGFPSELIGEIGEDEAGVITAAIESEKKQKCRWVFRPRTDKRKWLNIAEENARTAALAKSEQKNAYLNRMLELQELLMLDEMPYRIECFDISHSKGEATVASCTVFDQKGARKDLYRRFNIRGVAAGDDYAAINQAVFRHFSRLKEAAEAGEENAYPSVLLIDGAKGQVNKAHEALAELGIEDSVYLLGISKGETRKSGWEFLWELDAEHPITPDNHNPGFMMLQEVRDEAHRFAITGHRKQRAKARVSSGLEGIPGIGPKRRRELLRYFGSISAIKSASVDEIRQVPGINQKVAEDLYAALNGELK